MELACKNGISSSSFLVDNLLDNLELPCVTENSQNHITDEFQAFPRIDSIDFKTNSFSVNPDDADIDDDDDYDVEDDYEHDDDEAVILVEEDSSEEVASQSVTSESLSELAKLPHCTRDLLHAADLARLDLKLDALNREIERLTRGYARLLDPHDMCNDASGLLSCFQSSSASSPSPPPPPFCSSSMSSSSSRGGGAALSVAEFIEAENRQIERVVRPDRDSLLQIVLKYQSLKKTLNQLNRSFKQAISSPLQIYKQIISASSASLQSESSPTPSSLQSCLTSIQSSSLSSFTQFSSSPPSSLQSVTSIAFNSPRVQSPAAAKLHHSTPAISLSGAPSSHQFAPQSSNSILSQSKASDSTSNHALNSKSILSNSSNEPPTLELRRVDLELSDICENLKILLAVVSESSSSFSSSVSMNADNSAGTCCHAPEKVSTFLACTSPSSSAASVTPKCNEHDATFAVDKYHFCKAQICKVKNDVVFINLEIQQQRQQQRIIRLHKHEIMNAAIADVQPVCMQTHLPLGTRVCAYHPPLAAPPPHSYHCATVIGHDTATALVHVQFDLLALSVCAPPHCAVGHWMRLDQIRMLPTHPTCAVISPITLSEKNDVVHSESDFDSDDASSSLSILSDLSPSRHLSTTPLKISTKLKKKLKASSSLSSPYLTPSSSQLVWTFNKKSKVLHRKIDNLQLKIGDSVEVLNASSFPSSHFSDSPLLSSSSTASISAISSTLMRNRKRFHIGCTQQQDKENLEEEEEQQQQQKEEKEEKATSKTTNKSAMTAANYYGRIISILGTNSRKKPRIQLSWYYTWAELEQTRVLTKKIITRKFKEAAKFKRNALFSSRHVDLNEAQCVLRKINIAKSVKDYQLSLKAVVGTSTPCSTTSSATTMLPSMSSKHAKLEFETKKPIPNLEKASPLFKKSSADFFIAANYNIFSRKIYFGKL